MLNLLSWFKFNVGEGAFYSVFGFVFVFLGIALLVGIFAVLGIVMKKVNAKKPRVKKSKKGQPVEETVLSVEEEEGLSAQTVAAITAAIAMYYESENVKCDFVVKRIKKL
ncbi:MAG: OadG family protein [Clostridiales bacterium]|nr:OadG family protein [Clostridiales bacterium]